MLKQDYGYVGLFATRDTVEEAQDYFNSFIVTQQPTCADLVGPMVVINTLAKLLEDRDTQIEMLQKELQLRNAERS